MENDGDEIQLDASSGLMHEMDGLSRGIAGLKETARYIGKKGTICLPRAC